MVKLRFVVVHASSEDAVYPASELNKHAPDSVGWASARFSPFPQEIVLAFLPRDPESISRGNGNVSGGAFGGEDRGLTADFKQNRRRDESPSP
eukprot:scaffold63_cov306-Pinguiococcus_pyrenoidosus.AAC.32